MSIPDSDVLEGADARARARANFFATGLETANDKLQELARFAIRPLSLRGPEALCRLFRAWVPDDQNVELSLQPCRMNRVACRSAGDGCD